MHLGIGDYYSLTPNGYTKHTNVEVIGVDSRQPYPLDCPKEKSLYYS